MLSALERGDTGFEMDHHQSKRVGRTGSFTAGLETAMRFF